MLYNVTTRAPRFAQRVFQNDLRVAHAEGAVIHS